GVIAFGNGSYTLTKTGIGTLILAGANTFLPAVNVSAGILRLQNSAALGTPSDEVQLVTVTGATFTLTVSLTVANVAVTATTVSLTSGATAAQVASALNDALNAMVNAAAINAVNGTNGSVTVTGTGTVLDPYRVTFSGLLAGTNVPAMTASGATIATLRD